MWAAYVTALREAAGLSKADFGRRLGVDRTTVHRWENGRSRPDNPAIVQRLAAMFGVDLEQALSLAGLRPADEEPVETPPPLDPDLKALVRKLASPHVSPEEKTYIRATLRYLADLPTRQETPKPNTNAG